MIDYPELRKLQDIIDNQADRILDLEATLDRAVTRGLEQVERIATLEAALREYERDLTTSQKIARDICLGIFPRKS